MNDEQKNAIENSQYSKGHFGLCRNKGCWRRRRDKSAYCQSCSDKNKK